MFDEGWHVQLLSAGDFRPPQLIPALKALGMSGAVAVVSSADHEQRAERNELRELLGSQAFFELDVTTKTESESEPVSRILAELRQWRAAHTDGGDRD